MYPLKYLLIIFSVLPFNCFAQEKNDGSVTNVTKITIINPGGSYEKNIAKSQTIYLQGFMNLSGTIELSDSQGSEANLYFDPAYTIQYRYYYGLKRRDRKNARTAMNSANYLAALYESVFSKKNISNDYYTENTRRSIKTIGIVWGLQRNYHGRFSLDLNLGVGYLFAKTTSAYTSLQSGKKNAGVFTLPGQFNMGIWLNKRT